MSARRMMVVLCLMAGMVASATPSLGAELRKPQVAVGVPGRDVGGQRDAGAVEVRLASGRVQTLTAPGGRAGDRFGAAVAMPDLNGDRIEDLVVGAPGREASGLTNAGAVYVYLGTGSGFTHFRTLLPGTGVHGEAQANSGFGSVLDAARNEFVIGIPGYDVRGLADAGAAVLVWGTVWDTAPKLRLPNQLILADHWESDSDHAAAGDRFGAAVVIGPGLYIGAPGRTVDGKKGAGAVYDYDCGCPPYTVIDAHTRARAGDHFGASLEATSAALLIGVPDADIGSSVDAGRVEIRPFDGDPESIDQNSVDSVTGRPLTGAAEAGDRFGASLTAIGGTGKGPAFLVGVPGEDIGAASDAGMVNILHANLDYYTDASLGGVNEAGDRFGATAISWSSQARANLQAIGIPGEDSGRGAVRLAYPAKGTTWSTGARVNGDGYGSALSAGR